MGTRPCTVRRVLLAGGSVAAVAVAVAVVAGAARAREPHRVAYFLSELAGLFHPYYKAHRIITPDRATTLARLALCAAVGQVVRNGLDLLGVSAPDSMGRAGERD